MTATKTKKGPGRKPGSSNKHFGLPVKEATAELRLPLLQADISRANAVKADVNDPSNFMSCVIAQAVTRGWGAERVKIMREHAFVAFPGEGHVKRYIISPKSRRLLEAFDRGEPVIEGVELVLSPPGKARTRAGIRRQRRKYYAKHKDGGRRRKTARKQRSSDPLDGLVRNGNLVRWG